MKRTTLLLVLFCALVVGASAGPPNIATIPNAASIVIQTTDLEVGILDVKQNTKFTGTAGTAWNWQVIKLDIGADKVYTLEWDTTKFKDTYMPFPKKTVPAPLGRLLITIKHDAQTDTWAIVSTNERVSFECQTCPPR
jgi:hypothetical protein